MRVSHAEDHVTHAVIGGAQAIDFGITDSPEFMQMLSSVLYTDQILAVVRESLCNAWDAHIEAGVIDKAVVVTLTHNELVIRDYGPGIPKAKIGPIYGVYGGSTKKNDGKQTGGFGLGCKSPFAYGDHFDVTSFCEGEKTIYKMSKSSAQVGGKPSITPILTVPTDETGLELKLKIKETDYHRFEQLIRRIASNGDMNLMYNNYPINRIPFSKMEHDFMITKNQLIDNNNFVIYCRYGNVIYPVEDNYEYYNEYKEIKEFLSRLQGRSYHSPHNHIYRIVFQAQPHSISVTPSRESLAMQDHTINTLKVLFRSFLDLKNELLQARIYEATERGIENTYLLSSPAALLNQTANVPNLKMKDIEQEYLFNFDEMAIPYASSAYPEFNGFRKKDITTRLNSLIKSGFGNTGLIQSYRRRFNEPGKLQSDWLHRQVLAPLIYKLDQHPDLKSNKLFVYTNTEHRRGWGSEIGFVDPKKLPSRAHIDLLPFLRNLVVLSYNRQDVDTRADRFPIIRHWLGSVQNSLVYIVPRTPAKVEAARKFFKERGMYIVDLTQQQAWETPTAIAPLYREPKKPKAKGIPLLKNMLNEYGNLSSDRFNNIELPRTESPKFVMKFAGKNDHASIPPLGIASTKIIIDLYGNDCGMVVNQNQEDKYVAAGAQTAEQYIINDIYNQITTNPRIIESLPFDWTRSNTIGGSYDKDDLSHLMKAVYSDQELIDYFDLKWTLEPKDKMYLDLCADLIEGYGRFGYHLKEYKDLQNKFRLLKQDPKLEELENKMRESLFLRSLDWGHINNVMTKPTVKVNRDKVEVTPHYREKIRDLLLEAIES